MRAWCAESKERHRPASRSIRRERLLCALALHHRSSDNLRRHSQGGLLIASRFACDWALSWASPIKGEQAMRTRLVLALGCVFACSSAWAARPTCVTGTLASYIRLGAQGCTLDGITFANFSYSAEASAGARRITAEEITVAPQPVIPGETILGFSANWEVDKGQTLDSKIAYTAVLPCGDANPAMLELALSHAIVEGITGAVTVDESTNVGKLSVLDRCADSCETKPNASLQFDPVSVVLITDQVNLNGGIAGASLSGFDAGMDLCLVCA